MKILKNSKGYTLAELLISLMVTGLLATAGFQFYIQMHNSALNQEEVSEMQQSSRASLQEITKVLRMAGYKIGTHPAYEINSDGDSLSVYFSGVTPIDTVNYFLQDYADGLLLLPDELDEALKPRKLMRQVNNGTATVFADNIRDITFRAVSSSSVEVTIVVQPMKADEAYLEDEGFRSYTAVETIKLRNL